MFRPGDMVVLVERWMSDPVLPDLSESCPGIVIEVQNWVDSGDPKNNFGTNVFVLWSDSGLVEMVDEYDIDHYTAALERGNQTNGKGSNSPTD